MRDFIGKSGTRSVFLSLSNVVVVISVIHIANWAEEEEEEDNGVHSAATANDGRGEFTLELSHRTENCLPPPSASDRVGTAATSTFKMATLRRKEHSSFLRHCRGLRKKCPHLLAAHVKFGQFLSKHSFFDSIRETNRSSRGICMTCRPAAIGKLPFRIPLLYPQKFSQCQWPQHLHQSPCYSYTTHRPARFTACR